MIAEFVDDMEHAPLEHGKQSLGHFAAFETHLRREGRLDRIARGVGRLQNEGIAMRTILRLDLAQNFDPRCAGELFQSGTRRFWT